MAGNNNSVAGAAICGGATCCILVCLFVLGVPILIAGIVLVNTFSETDELGDEGAHTAGIVCIVIACVMIVAGVITAIFTCVFVGRAAESSRVPTQGQVITVQQTPYQPGYPQPGYPGVPQNQSQAYYPPPGVQSYPPPQSQAYYPSQVQSQGQGDYPSKAPADSQPQVYVQTGPTAAQYGGNQDPSYAQY